MNNPSQHDDSTQNGMFNSGTGGFSFGGISAKTTPVSFNAKATPMGFNFGANHNEQDALAAQAQTNYMLNIKRKTHTNTIRSRSSGLPPGMRQINPLGSAFNRCSFNGSSTSMMGGDANSQGFGFSSFQPLSQNENAQGIFGNSNMYTDNAANAMNVGNAINVGNAMNVGNSMSFVNNMNTNGGESMESTPNVMRQEQKKMNISDSSALLFGNNQGFVSGTLQNQQPNTIFGQLQALPNTFGAQSSFPTAMNIEKQSQNLSKNTLAPQLNSGRLLDTSNMNQQQTPLNSFNQKSFQTQSNLPKQTFENIWNNDNLFSNKPKKQNNVNVLGGIQKQEQPPLFGHPDFISTLPQFNENSLNQQKNLNFPNIPTQTPPSSHKQFSNKQESPHHSSQINAHSQMDTQPHSQMGTHGHSLPQHKPRNGVAFKNDIPDKSPDKKLATQNPQPIQQQNFPPFPQSASSSDNSQNIFNRPQQTFNATGPDPSKATSPPFSSGTSELFNLKQSPQPQQPLQPHDESQPCPDPQTQTQSQIFCNYLNDDKNLLIENSKSSGVQNPQQINQNISTRDQHPQSPKPLGFEIKPTIPQTNTFYAINPAPFPRPGLSAPPADPANNKDSTKPDKSPVSEILESSIEPKNAQDAETFEKTELGSTPNAVTSPLGKNKIGADSRDKENEQKVGAYSLFGNVSEKSIFHPSSSTRTEGKSFALFHPIDKASVFAPDASNKSTPKSINNEIVPVSTEPPEHKKNALTTDVDKAPDAVDRSAPSILKSTRKVDSTTNEPHENLSGKSLFAHKTGSGSLKIETPSTQPQNRNPDAKPATKITDSNGNSESTPPGGNKFDVSAFKFHESISNNIFRVPSELTSKVHELDPSGIVSPPKSIFSKLSSLVPPERKSTSIFGGPPEPPSKPNTNVSYSKSSADSLHSNEPPRLEEESHETRYSNLHLNSLNKKKVNFSDIDKAPSKNSIFDLNTYKASVGPPGCVGSSVFSPKSTGELKIPEKDHLPDEKFRGNSKKRHLSEDGSRDSLKKSPGDANNSKKRLPNIENVDANPKKISFDFSTPALPHVKNDKYGASSINKRKILNPECSDLSSNSNKTIGNCEVEKNLSVIKTSSDKICPATLKDSTNTDVKINAFNVTSSLSKRKRVRENVENETSPLDSKDNVISTFDDPGSSRLNYNEEFKKKTKDVEPSAQADFSVIDNSSIAALPLNFETLKNCDENVRRDIVNVVFKMSLLNKSVLKLVVSRDSESKIPDFSKSFIDYTSKMFSLKDNLSVLLSKATTSINTSGI